MPDIRGFYNNLLQALAPGKNTLSIREAIRVWEKTHPFSEEDASRTRHIRQALDVLRAEGLIAAQNDGKMSLGNILFPASIRFPALARKKGRDYAWAAGYEWHPALAEYAAQMPSAMLDDARKIDAWLKERDMRQEQWESAELVPLCERSYEIFGDEKYISRKWRKGLFGRIAAPFSLIGAYWPPVPLAFSRPESQISGLPLLLLENQHTYASFCRWNRQAARWSAVAFGRGGAVEGMPQSIAAVMRECGAGQVEYFGDLDPAGILILNDLAAKCDFPVLPLQTAYAWLIGRERGNACSPTAYGERESAALARLMPELKDKILAIWQSGRRIPQEALGYRHLLAGALRE